MTAYHRGWQIEPQAIGHSATHEDHDPLWASTYDALVAKIDAHMDGWRAPAMILRRG